MKKIFLFSICLTALRPCFSQVWMHPYPPAAQNSKEIIFRNKIRSESIYSYKFNKKKITDSTCIARLTFDSLGNMSKEEDINEYHTTTTNINYQYNEDSSIHKKTTEFSFPGSKPMTVEYEYDSAGNPTGVFTYNPDTTFLEVEKSLFNETHQLVATYKKTPQGDFFLIYRWYYSEDGVSSKEEFYNEKGVLYKSYIVEFDPSNNKRTSYYKDEKGKKTGIEAFFLDSNRRYVTHQFNAIGTSYNSAFRRPEVNDTPAMEQYSYNPDGSFFECTTLLDNSKSNIFRVYYNKN